MGAAFRSILIPGWGQMATSRLTTGKVLLFATGLAGIAALTVFLFVEPVELAAWLADPDVILAVILVNLLVLLVRLFSTESAWRAGGGHRWFAALFLAAVVSIPHVAIGWVGLEARGSMLRLFPEAVAAAPPVSTTTTVPPTTTTTRLELSPIVTLAGQYGDDDLKVSRTEGWHPFGSERLNILLLGGDSGPRRTGLRTDTMMVASIDPVSGDAAMIGVPRNYGRVALKDGTVPPVTQLGHVYSWGERHADRYPDSSFPGQAATRDAIENLTGLEIDYFVLVDLTGFADVVDAFGGVTLDVAAPVDGPLYDVETGGYEMVTIPVGTQHLDGAHALAYARARYGSSDYARMGRQRCILASMASQADLLELFGRIGELLDAVESNLVTDLPAELIPELIRLTPRISATSIRLIGFDDKWGTGRTVTGHIIPDVDRIREAVRLVVEDPTAATEAGVATAETGC